MATRVIMPTLGLTMEQGTIARWLKREGDSVERDEPLFTVETDKATMDVPAPAAGIVARLLVPEGATVPVLEAIAVIAAPGEAVPEVAHVPSAPPPPSVGVPAAPAVASATPPTAADVVSTGYPGSAGVPPAQSVPQVAAPSVSDGAAASGAARPGWPASPRARRVAAELRVDLFAITGTGPGGRIVEADVRRAAAGQTGAPMARVSPLAQRRALELGVDLAAVVGTGPGGRVNREDVEAAAAAPVAPLTAAPTVPPGGEPPVAAAPGTGVFTAPPAPTPAATRGGRLATLSRLRRITAERMAQSARSVARVTLFAEVDFVEAVRFRGQLLPEFERRYAARLTYDALLARACALALQDHPALNAHWTDEGPRLFDQVDVGVAISVADGLVVPAVRDVAGRPLWAITRDLNDLGARAQAGRLAPDEFGSTFTITNLGAQGVESFTPIVNPPEVAILGVGAIQPRPVVVDGAVAVRDRVTLSLAFDHRAIDGAPAAAFLGRVRHILENPYILLT